jgi:hypothetical protein
MTAVGYRFGAIPGAAHVTALVAWLVPCNPQSTRTAEWSRDAQLAILQATLRPSRHIEIVESCARQHYTLTAERDCLGFE